MPERHLRRARGYIGDVDCLRLLVNKPQRLERLADADHNLLPGPFAQSYRRADAPTSCVCGLLVRSPGLPGFLGVAILSALGRPELSDAQDSFEPTDLFMYYLWIDTT